MRLLRDVGREQIEKIMASLAQPRADAGADPSTRRSNVDLITGINEKQRARLVGLLEPAQRTGVRHEDLIKEIQDIVGTGKSRATLIARDQTVKHNAATQQAQAKAAGITRYRWRITRDEATRPMHRALDGKEFSYDQPPVTNKNGDRNHPGEDYQCRCQAEPVIDLFAGLDDRPAPEPIKQEPAREPAPKREREPRIPAAARRTIETLEAGIAEQDLKFSRDGYRAPLQNIYEGAPPDLVDAIATGQTPPPGSRNVLPPITITGYPDGTIVLVDGRHRLEAAQRAGAKFIRATVKQYDKALNVVSEVERLIPVPPPDEAKKMLLAGGPRSTTRG